MIEPGSTLEFEPTQLSCTTGSKYRSEPTSGVPVETYDLRHRFHNAYWTQFHIEYWTRFNVHGLSGILEVSHPPSHLISCWTGVAAFSWINITIYCILTGLSTCPPAQSASCSARTPWQLLRCNMLISGLSSFNTIQHIAGMCLCSHAIILITRLPGTSQDPKEEGRNPEEVMKIYD